jgi:hypothetical protein
MEAAFEFHATYNATATTMMTIALKNRQPATDYA